MPHTATNVTRFRDKSSDCANCRLAALCLPVSLTTQDVEAFDQIVQRAKPVARGNYLFQSGAPFRSIYAVRSGAVKMTNLASDGVEHVSGFHLPGEIIGLDGIGFDHHPTSAVTLDTTALCEIPYTRLEELSEQVPGLQRQLVRTISRELFAEQEIAQALAKRSAEERLAIVLLNLSERYAKRGLSATRFCLPMSRHDLGDYLGLAPETMSRLFKRMQEQGLLSTQGKEVHLDDVDGLRKLAALTAPGHAAARRLNA